MDLFSPMSQLQNNASQFSLAEVKLKSLNQKLQTHENKEELMKTAKQFEAVLFKQLLTEMDKTIDRSNSLFGSGSAEESFRGLMYDNIAENISTRAGGSGFGIAEAIYRQLEGRVRDAGTSEGESGSRKDVQG